MVTIAGIRMAAQTGQITAYMKDGEIYVRDTVTGESTQVSGWEDKETWSFPDNKDVTVTTQARQTNQPPYSGFLLLKCGNCGKARAFNARTPLYVYRCKACGGETDLGELVPAYLNCRCGKKYKYLTNIEDDQITHRCLDCGAETTMVKNGRGTAFVTPKEGER